MRFSKRMLRAVVSSVFVIALLGPLVGVSQAQHSVDPAPDVFLFGVEADTSEVDSFFTNANRVEEIFDAADEESNMATDAILSEMPTTFPRKYSAQVSSKTKGGSTLILDPSFQDDPVAVRSSDTIASRDDRKLDLRAGAFVPPTRGRFVKIQNRWSFVPDNPASAVVVQETKTDTSKLENTFRAVSAMKKLRSETQPGVELIPGNPLRNGASDREKLLNQIGTQRTEAVMSSMSLTQLVVVENLMLQRVVDSIQADKVGDQWIVSGSITPLKDGNQIELRSAKPVRR